MAMLTVGELVKDRHHDELIVQPETVSVAEAVALMADRGVGAVLAMSDEGPLSGIFTERDLLLRVVAAGGDPVRTRLSSVMSRDVKVVSPSTPSEAALALMVVERLRHLLVLDGANVLGLVSMRDLVVQMIRGGEGRYESDVRAAMRPGTEKP